MHLQQYNQPPFIAKHISSARPTPGRQAVIPKEEAGSERAGFFLCIVIAYTRLCVCGNEFCAFDFAGGQPDAAGPVAPNGVVLYRGFLVEDAHSGFGLIVYGDLLAVVGGQLEDTAAFGDQFIASVQNELVDLAPFDIGVVCSVCR